MKGRPFQPLITVSVGSASVVLASGVAAPTMPRAWSNECTGPPAPSR